MPLSERVCYIRACWASREESPESIAQRFVSLIDRLRQIDAALDPWTIVTQRGGPKKFEALRDNFAEFVRRQMSRDDFGLSPLEGYSFGAITRDQSQSAYYSLSVNAGSHLLIPELNQNSVGFKMNLFEGREPIPVSFSIFKSVLLAIIQTWAPDDCVVIPEGLLDRIDLGRHFKDSWMQYLAKPFADLVTPPENILSERFADGGLLMTATTESFDVDNPAHVAAAHAIATATAGLEDLPYVYKPPRRAAPR
jgi:hypothetical protein